jgi:hypothetical protein
MPPWKHQGARTCSIILVPVRAVQGFNGRVILPHRARTPPTIGTSCQASQTALYATQATPITPLRKQLKDEARAKRVAEADGHSEISLAGQEKLKNWELTVGIEIHAQLNTAKKLFSRRFSARAAYPRLTISRRGHIYR